MSPRAAMRAAGEEAADIGPDSGKVPTAGLTPATRSALLTASIRTAIREELGRVAREGTLLPGPGEKSAAASGGAASGGGSSDREGQGELGQLHKETLSSQQAKHNRAVQLQQTESPGPHNNSAGSAASLAGAGSKR